MESLSDKVLLEIFVYLDSTSLKNCTEVSKRWDKLISRSASTMDKLTLKVDKSSKMRDLRDIKRRYSNMAVYQMTISHQIWSQIMNCQQQLRKLELNAIETTELNFKKILQSMPTLHELKLYDCKITSMNGESIEAVKVPMLQSLTLGINDPAVFECIDMSTLKKLELIDHEPFDLFGFIGTLQELEDLTVTVNEGYNGVLSFISNYSNFQLKKLGIRSPYDHVIARANFLIGAHASTLEKLELNWPEGEVANYDLTIVAPSNSLLTASFDDFYEELLHNNIALPAQAASTAKYYLPQMKLIKISNLNLR